MQLVNILQVQGCCFLSDKNKHVLKSTLSDAESVSEFGDEKVIFFD